MRSEPKKPTQDERVRRARSTGGLKDAQTSACRKAATWERAPGLIDALPTGGEAKTRHRRARPHP